MSRSDRENLKFGDVLGELCKNKYAFYGKKYFKPDFLRNAVCYNFSELIIETSKYTSIKKEYKSYACKLETEENVIIIPNNFQTLSRQFVNMNLKKIRSIVYAGVLDQDMLIFLHENSINMIWDERKCWEKLGENLLYEGKKGING